MRSVPKAVQRQLLEGRPLMWRTPADKVLASELAQWLNLKGIPRTCHDFTQWSQVFSKQLHRLHSTSSLSMGSLGSLLLESLRERPGSLGEFVRFLPAVTHENSRLDVLPIDPKIFESRSICEGVRAWATLLLLGINYMYCGQDRLLSETFHYPACCSPLQDRVVNHLLKVASSWVSSSSVSWDSVFEEFETAGDSYGPKVDTVAFPLCVESVLPSLPDKKHCAQIDICKLVSESTREMLEHPTSVLFEPAEFVPSSKVLVRTQRDWDILCAALFERNLIEACDEGDIFHIGGKPVLNGAFGVHKKWTESPNSESLRVLRFISNLIPANSLIKAVPGASQSMGYPALWAQIHLQGEQQLALYSEDQQGCFHLYRVPPAWRRLFVFSRQCSAESVGQVGEPKWVRLTVVPMGWSLAVDVVQEAHETLIRKASALTPTIGTSRLMQLRSLFPSSLDEHGNYYQSVYVDNWDQLMVVLKSAVAELEGKPSEGQQALRTIYQQEGVARAEDKAVCGADRMQSLGVEVRGLEGTIGTPLSKRWRVALMCFHAALSLKVPPTLLRTLLGKLVHCLEFRRPLLSNLELSFAFVLQHNHAQPLPLRVADELLLSAMLLPLAQADLRTSFRPQVTASDASPSGGGSCITTGLTQLGRNQLHSLDLKDQRQVIPYLLIAFAAGAGAPRQALTLLDVTPVGFIAVEPHKGARRVVRAAWPDVQQVCTYAELTETRVSQWRFDYKQARSVLLYAAVSSTAAVPGKETPAGSPIPLQTLTSFLTLLDQLSWAYSGVVECLPQDSQAVRALTSLFRVPPMVLEGGSFSWVARDRVYFLFKAPSVTPSYLVQVGLKDSTLPTFTASPNALPSLPDISLFLEEHSTRAVSD
eukprot:5575480-Amphidinium_carterae.1